MQELINSVARLSAAMTLFGVQEMQKVVGAALDPPAFLNRVSTSLDSISNAIVAELDPDTRPTLESVANLGREFVDRAFETLRAPGLDPMQVLRATGDMVRTAADAMVKPETSPAASAEPQPAVEVLTGK